MGVGKQLLVVVTGPTASGKSSLAVDIALRLGTEIISADSRQIYKQMNIGTAVPPPEDLARVRHHFVQTLEPKDYYSAACFEEDVMKLLPDVFGRCGGSAVMCGGSMMYVAAVTRGIDELPTVSASVREKAAAIFRAEGSEGVIERLRHLDPAIMNVIDTRNPRRLIHALEICMEAGRPYSELRTGAVKERPFRTVVMAVDYHREDLFNRINSRVDAMIGQGLVEEARKLYGLRSLNALNTVGYKELFDCFDGLMDLPTAIERLKKNTRVYAKKQLTWMKKRPEIHLLDPYSSTPIINQALALL